MKQDSIELEEVTAVRAGCVYEVSFTEPTAGRWWAVKLVPVSFPDDNFHPTTKDGHQVEQVAVIAATRRYDNRKWQWCHLTQAAKLVFGDLLFSLNLRNDWFYIREVDAQSSGRA